MLARFGYNAPSLSGLRVLCISPTPTHPTLAGNRARYRALLDRLQARAAAVRLVFIDQEPGDIDAMNEHWHAGTVRVSYTRPAATHARWNRFAARIRKYAGIPLPQLANVDDWFDAATTAPVRAQVEAFQPHVVLMLYYWHSALLDMLADDVLRVLDAQDVFTDRTARMARTAISQQWYSVPRAEEARGLNRFDIVLAIQEHEAQYYRSISRTRVETIGHFLPLLDTGAVPVASVVLIIGSDNEVNIHGVRWFVDEVWPLLRTRAPEALLRIAGRVGEHIAPQPGIDLCGVVLDLATAYAAAALVVNPLRGGTGLKIKGAEALGAGRVVVSTSSAAEGLEAAVGRGLVIADAAGDMADCICGLLKDRARLNELATEARDFASSWNREYENRFDAIFSDAAAAVGRFASARSAGAARTP